MKSLSYCEIEDLIGEIDEGIKPFLLESLKKIGVYPDKRYSIKGLIRTLYKNNVYGKEDLSAALLIDGIDDYDKLLGWLREESHIVNFPYGTEKELGEARRSLDLKYIRFID